MFLYVPSFLAIIDFFRVEHITEPFYFLIGIEREEKKKKDSTVAKLYMCC